MTEYTGAGGHAHWRLITGDNMEVCRQLAGEGRRFNLILGSPPYNLNASPSARQHANSSKGGILPSGVAYDGFADNEDEEVYQTRQVETLNLLYNLIERSGSLFYNHQDRIWNEVTIDPASWIARSAWLQHQRIIWDQTRTHVHNTHFCSQFTEWMFWCVPLNWWGFETLNHAIANQGNIWRIPNPTYTEAQKRRLPPYHPVNYHPCPWPVELAERVILLCTQPGDRVLDPWGGSHVVGDACLRTGRIYTGIDQSDYYNQMAARRLAMWQPPLFHLDTAIPLPGMEGA